MAPVTLKLVLLLAVLVQYAPLRYCSMERVVLGSNCHDRGTHVALGDPHADDEQSCGFPGDRQRNCVCEQPKVDARHDPHGMKSSLEWAHVPVAAVSPLVVAVADNPSPLKPDPHPGAAAATALQLPLLI